jgi:transcriptional regulator with XRE-family HTH domain
MTPARPSTVTSHATQSEHPQHIDRQHIERLPQSSTAGAESLGPLLTRLRRGLGRSQLRLAAQLCDMSGVDTISRHEISRWEREERIPTRFWRPWLAEVLGVPLSVIEAAAVITRSRRRVATSPPWRMIELRADHDADGNLRFTPVRATSYRP